MSQHPDCRLLHASLGIRSEKENAYIKCYSVPPIVLGALSVMYLCMDVYVCMHTHTVRVVMPSKPANTAKHVSISMVVSIIRGCARGRVASSSRCTAKAVVLSFQSVLNHSPWGLHGLLLLA